MTENVPATTRSRMPAVIDQHVANLSPEMQAKLKAEAEAMKVKIGGGQGAKIRLTKSKKFKLPDGQESPGPLRVVVLDAIAYNAFYDRPFSEKEKTPPACFALGAVQPKDLVPSPTSPDVQSKACKYCPNNVFGSKGAGKACGNHYRLAVVGIDKPDSELYELQVPAGSVKYWEAAVGQIRARYGLGPIVVSTEVWFNPDKEHQEIRFGNFEANPFLEQHMERIAEAKALIEAEPDVSTYKPLPKRGGR